MTWEILEGDALERLRGLPDRSVQTCITSPPYYGLRDYGDPGQLGLESTPDLYVARLVEMFREVRRVLRDDGTLWLNLGDSYFSPTATQGRNEDKSVGSLTGGTAKLIAGGNSTYRRTAEGVKPKDLLGIPWMVAFALRADGWYLRSDIIWAKPNPMPESVTDRPTKAHEYVFLLSKSARYFYDADAVREEHATADDPRNRASYEPSRGRAVGMPDGDVQRIGTNGPSTWPASGRNKRSVWTVATQPFPGAHFAVFPPKLIEPCVLAGSSEAACGVCGAPWGRVTEHVPAESPPLLPKDVRTFLGVSPKSTLGSSNSHDGAKRVGSRKTLGWQPTCTHHDDTGTSTVLDPFCGGGTTGVVADRHGRNFIGIELNPAYARMARLRMVDDAPLFHQDHFAQEAT